MLNDLNDDIQRKHHQSAIKVSPKCLSNRVSAAYPCSPGKQYYGRAAKQLSWNYNYGTEKIIMEPYYNYGVEKI